jgi:hypothetical protein
MSKPGADPSSGISLGDALRLPKRHPAWRRHEAAAPTARPKVLMRRRGADCLVVVRHRLCRPTANETLVSHCRLVGIELRRRVCFFVVLKRGNARGAKGGGSSPLRSGQPATGVAVRLTAPAYARGRRTVSIRTFRRRIGGSCRVHKSDSKIDSASSVSSAAPMISS